MPALEEARWMEPLDPVIEKGRGRNKVTGKIQKNIFSLAALILASAALIPVEAEDRKDHYWEWGVGAYFGGLGNMTLVDVARYDWLYLCFGNISASKETAELLNQMLEVNPDLKIVIRVWPIMGAGDCKENRYQATFLHYLYKPGVKEKVLKNVRDQIRVVLDHISKPQNVVGLTFLEELPGHFSGSPFYRKDGDDVGWCMERFRKEIEAERGKPLRWENDTREWWADKWVQVINEIHAEMKKESDGRKLFYYLATGHSTWDMVPAGTKLGAWGLIPHHLKEVIKPGLCDGLFAYPNNEKIWKRKYAEVVKKNDWLLFSQASHPSGMRLCRWSDNLRMAREKFPQNLGYFFYCGGACAATKAWNADPGIPPGPEWNTRGVSMKRHIRRHLALENVGMDIVRKQTAVRLHVDFPLDKAKPGGFIHVNAIVENTRESSFYLDPNEAVARNVRVTFQRPKELILKESNSAPATITIGDLKPGERRVADWWVYFDEAYDGKLNQPVKFIAKSERGAPFIIEMDKDMAIPDLQAHEIGIPGTEWMEPGYRLPAQKVKPVIRIDVLRDEVRHPSVSDGYQSIAWNGQFFAGQSLIIDPEKGARMFHLPLVSDEGSSWQDADDPSGYRAFEDGYLIGRLSSQSRVDPAVPLKVTISGKSRDGGQSLVVLRFDTRKGHVDRSGLANRFNDKWRTVSAEFKVPKEAISLRNVFLYRFKSKGRVWYGGVKVDRTDARPEGTDVSDRLRGSFPEIERQLFRMFSYRDDNPLSTRPRVRVQLSLPDL
jgi:hypothetical protein